MGLFETAKSNAESFMIAIKELINSASFNKSFRATVTEKINNTVYKVSYKNAEYKVKSYYNLLVGDLVWVCAPGNDWDSLFVQSYNGFHDRVITTDKVVNNLTTNVAGTVLDGRIGKLLNDKIITTNSNFDNYYTKLQVDGKLTGFTMLPDDTLGVNIFPANVNEKAIYLCATKVNAPKTTMEKYVIEVYRDTDFIVQKWYSLWFDVVYYRRCNVTGDWVWGAFKTVDMTTL